MAEQRHPSVAVIGAGDYIGAAIARRFAREGYLVHAGRRNGEKLAPLVEEISAAGGRCRAGRQGVRRFRQREIRPACRGAKHGAGAWAKGHPRRPPRDRRRGRYRLGAGADQGSRRIGAGADIDGSGVDRRNVLAAAPTGSGPRMTSWGVQVSPRSSREPCSPERPS